MKSCAILQSNYIPWKGYFDLINSVDDFVFFDTAQFTKNDWRNRNKIKTQSGSVWLTIPCEKKRLGQSIEETMVADQRWSQKHWKSIEQNYSKAAYWKEYGPIFEDWYSNAHHKRLSEINADLISIVCEILDINTKFHWSSDLKLETGKTERLIGICEQLGASTYVSGPAAKDYFDVELAETRKLDVVWMDYSGYPEYAQMHDPFDHAVSIIDMIFCLGPRSKNYMKSFR